MHRINSQRNENDNNGKKIYHLTKWQKFKKKERKKKKYPTWSIIKRNEYWDTLLVTTDLQNLI